MAFSVKYAKRDEVTNVNGNSFVWRYMRHDKFERLVKDSSLWFSRASEMTDKYEATIPEKSIKAFRESLIGSNKTKIDKHQKEYDFYWENEPDKNASLINCWSKDRDENYALWKIYLGGESDGVAIRTTASKLRQSLISEKRLASFNPHLKYSMAEVRYSHFIKYEDLSPAKVITTKKPFYKFENEVRLFSLQNDYDESLVHQNEKGINVPVNLEILIGDIYVSPFSQMNYKKKVESLFRYRPNLKNKIKLSQVWDS